MSKKPTEKWLRERYVDKNIPVKDILEEGGLSKTTFYRLIDEFSIEKKRLHLDREWLTSHYIDQNLSIVKISKLAGVSKTSIARAIKKLGLKKSQSMKKLAESTSRKNSCVEKYGTDQFFSSESFRDKKKKTMVEKYGVEHSSQSPSLRLKYEKTMIERYGDKDPLSNKTLLDKKNKTMLDRYGTEVPLKNEEILKGYRETMNSKYSIDIFEENRSDKVHTRKIMGMTLKEFALENDVSYTSLTQFLRGRNNVTKEDINSFLERIRKNISNIEFIFSKEFGINLYNKKVGHYRPDFKLSESLYVNVDGLYWHSEVKQSDRKYHFNMRKEYERMGLSIVQIRSDEILDPNKLSIVSSIIENKRKKIKNRVYARKCIVKSIKQSDADNFLLKNHLMGTIKARHIGLFHNDEIVSIFSFKNFKNKLKVERFCSKINGVVVGGFSKLLKHMEIKLSPREIHYWVDLRYGTGEHLVNRGFSLKKETLGWKWTDFKRTYNRLKCRANMDDRRMTQKEYAKELGLVKIYDAGQRLYIKELRSE